MVFHVNLTHDTAIYAQRAAIAKSDYILYQAAAMAFISLSLPYGTERDPVQIHCRKNDIPVFEPFVDLTHRMAEIEEQSLRVATVAEWQKHTHTMSCSKLFLQPRGHLPIEDLFLGTCITRQIDAYHKGEIDRLEAVNVLLQEADRSLGIYTRQRVLFIQAARMEHSRKWVEKATIKLGLTNSPPVKPRSRSRDVIWKELADLNGKYKPFGDAKAVSGKFRKPLKRVFVGAMVLTVLSGITYYM